MFQYISSTISKDGKTVDIIVKALDAAASPRKLKDYIARTYKGIESAKGMGVKKDQRGTFIKVRLTYPADANVVTVAEAENGKMVTVATNEGLLCQWN